ncbi:MAG: metallophosphoesterase [Acidimicrobiales bacterium]|nr:metallophosphoesterase [Acidimicrobiales bacterium]
MDEERGPDTDDIEGPPPDAARPAAEPGDVGRPGRLARARRAVADLADGRRWPALRLVVFALAGASLAVVVFGHVSAKIGPFETTLSARPSLTGQTVVHLAPLGTIQIDTHDWPISLDLRLDEIGLAEAERIAQNPDEIDTLGDDAADEVRSALVDLAVKCVILALLGGIAGALVARLSWRTACAGAGVAMVFVSSVGVGAAATFEPNAVAEPRYTGLLTQAPTAVGDIEEVLSRFGEYRAQLGDLVDNMAALYLAGSELPTFAPDSEMVRVLHVSDIHLNPHAFDLMARLTEQFGIDVIADTGDLTDWGTDPETEQLTEIGDLGVPYVYVRGNHDSRRTQQVVAEQPNAVVLDGDAATVAGLRFWGIGDPRYTPDKSAEGTATEQERAEAFAPVVAERLAADEPPPIDVAMVHDRRMALDLGGEVPLVLAGHTHEPRERRIEPLPAEEGSDASGDDSGTSGDEASTTGDGESTLLLEEGSTGGAGLRGLQGEEPEPLAASILYFDRDTRQLVAYDRISVAWLQAAGATIERHIVARDLGTEPAG